MHVHRPAAVAGTFYPGTQERLLHQVDDLLGRAKGSEGALIGNPVVTRAVPKAMIVPHAGYIYSGPIAARAYARLLPAAPRIRRVVLLGPAHRAYIDGLALPEATIFDTPLGRVEIDSEPSLSGPSGSLARLPGVVQSAAAHAREHSLEVQLPFLQRILPDFRLIPFAVGDARPEIVANVIEALWGGPETVVIVSSDLSHYLPYEVGRTIDQETADRIVELSPRLIDHDQACGATPINGLLVVARRRHLRAELIDLRSSGDTAGDKSAVVGYGAFAFYEEAA